MSLATWLLIGSVVLVTIIAVYQWYRASYYASMFETDPFSVDLEKLTAQFTVKRPLGKPGFKVSALTIVDCLEGDASELEKRTKLTLAVGLSESDIITEQEFKLLCMKAVPFLVELTTDLKKE